MMEKEEKKRIPNVVRIGKLPCFYSTDNNKLRSVIKWGKDNRI